MPGPVIGRSEGQAGLGQKRQRTRPVPLSRGQPRDPGVDHGLQDRAAVDPRRRPCCGQQGRGGLVLAPFQKAPGFGQAGEVAPQPVRFSAMFPQPLLARR